ncbi:uncharacterized protein [Misgurnus anguillicaudatus]|uniref:uncharacterized protein n=1 Tax=Misgurnus anguillicaudatus TaxID=75329 RepID=UPI003CCFBBBF
MLLLWITLCFTWPGTMGFTVHSIKEGLCLEDSFEGEVYLKKCNLDSDLQQWMWTDRWFLLNTGTMRCLSTVHSDSVQTVKCNSDEHIKWHCKAQEIFSVKNSLSLSAEGGKLVLDVGQHRWTSLDADDICQDKLRSRRQSETDFERDFDEDMQKPKMTVAQMKFLQWYYRTEDPTSWKFAMLGFAFLGLLIGCVIVVMDMMGSRSRKQIAKYRSSTKVTGVKPEMEELQVIIKDQVKQEKNCSTPLLQNSHTDSKSTNELKPGEIVVTWKDGNISSLYPEAVAYGEVKEEVQSLDIKDSHDGQDVETPNTPDESEDHAL